MEELTKKLEISLQTSPPFVTLLYKPKEHRNVNLMKLKNQLDTFVQKTALSFSQNVSKEIYIFRKLIYKMHAVFRQHKHYQMLRSVLRLLDKIEKLNFHHTLAELAGSIVLNPDDTLRFPSAECFDSAMKRLLTGIILCHKISNAAKNCGQQCLKHMDMRHFVDLNLIILSAAAKLWKSAAEYGKNLLIQYRSFVLWIPKLKSVKPNFETWLCDSEKFEEILLEIDQPTKSFSDLKSYVIPLQEYLRSLNVPVDFNVTEVRRNLFTEFTAATENPNQSHDIGIPIDSDLGIPIDSDLGIPIDSTFKKTAKLKSQMQKIKTLKQLVAFSKNCKLELKSIRESKDGRKFLETRKQLHCRIRQLIKLNKAKDIKSMKTLFKSTKRDFISAL